MSFIITWIRFEFDGVSVLHYVKVGVSFLQKNESPASLSYQLNALQYRRMDFEEFCAAALSVHQLEALDRWEQHARCAYDLFEKDGNRAIMIEELASVSAFLLGNMTDLLIQYNLDTK